MKHKNSYKMGLTFGIIGCLAGIGLVWTGNKVIGIFGALASASLIVKGLKEMKALKNQDTDLE